MFTLFEYLTLCARRDFVCIALPFKTAPLRTIFKNLILQLIVGHYSPRVAVRHVLNRGKFMTNFFNRLDINFMMGHTLLRSLKITADVLRKTALDAEK